MSVARWARLGPALLSIILVLAAAAPARADAPAPDQSQVAALTAQVNYEAGRIHQLTEQLDQARLQVSSTASRLAGVTEQHNATVQQLNANRSTLLDQAVQAYMHGGAASRTTAGATADVTIGAEYLRVASGDMTDIADRLRLTDANLRADQATLEGAQQANLQATAQLEALRTNALSAAAAAQTKLDRMEAQLAAQAQAQAQAQAAASAQSPAPVVGRTTTGATQGLPVNNGLLTVVQQAAGLPIAAPVSTPAKPVATTPTTVASSDSASATSSGGGGHAGGVWLALRRCESSDNYAENTGNGFYGAYQFSQATWTGLGYPGRPDQESPAMQDQAAMALQAQSGWGQWPACASALGLK
jgi:hypothetical protein